MGGFFHSYHQTALRLLESYSFNDPFAVYLKQYFKKVKKHGSKDRRIVSDLCYGYFRLGNTCSDLDTETKLAIGFFLTHNADTGYLAWLNFPLLDIISEKPETKLRLVAQQYPGFHFEKFFPVYSSCMPEINLFDFTLSFFCQPPFFLRVRPGKQEIINKQIIENNLPANWLNDHTIRVESNFKLSDVLNTDKDCVIQDISSQQTFNLLHNIKRPVNVIWDVCTGSGGKSIMAADWFPKSRIFASDIREQILFEWHRRMQVAGIRNISAFCTDLEHPMSSSVVRSHLPTNGADLIIADVPCTGSGTWARSPERLLQMDLELIQQYQQRQKSIVQRLPQHLKKGGYLLYITCSVYAEENTAIVEFILQNTLLKLLGIEMITSYEKGGDSLFTALFTLPE